MANDNKPVTVGHLATPEIVSRDANLAAQLTKIVPSKRHQATHDARGNRTATMPTGMQFREHTDQRVKRNRDSATVLKILPDLELAVQILVSSLGSPGDLMTPQLTFNPAPDLFTSDVSAALINEVRQYFETDYNLTSMVPVMLRQMIAEKGSYPVAVIPENALDAFINGPMSHLAKEALGGFLTSDHLPKPVGILGPGLIGGPANPTRRSLGLAMEGLGQGDKPVVAGDPHLCLAYEDINKNEVTERDTYVTVTDNIAVLKFPAVLSKLRGAQLRSKLNSQLGQISLESASGVTDRRIEQHLFTNRHRQGSGGTQIAAALKTQGELNRRSVGEPLRIVFPSESVMPVYTPGDVSKHISYFVLLDEEGHALSLSDDSEFYKAGNRYAAGRSHNSVTSNLLNRVNANIGNGSQYTDFGAFNSTEFNYASQLYGEMVERDLLARVRNGVHGAAVKLSSNGDVYRLMLARTLENRYTQLLYIPGEYMTYMTFKYDKQSGMGMSLLDDLSTVNAMRAVLMFSDIIGAVRNSIGRTRVNITLPDTDPDGVNTLEVVKDLLVRGKQLNVPFSIETPYDITNFLERAGIEFSFKGGNLPELEYEIEQKADSYAKADSELTDSLRKMSLSGLGVPPEMVDQALNNAEFATTARANNALFSKRIITLQDTYNPLLARHARQVVRYTGDLLAKLVEIVKKEKDCVKLKPTEGEKEYLASIGADEAAKYMAHRALAEFIDTFTVALPRPPEITLTAQKDELSSYEELLDMALEKAFMGDDMVPESVSGSISKIRSQVKAYFIRKYMSEKGIAPELFELVGVTEDGQPQVNLLTEVANHLEALTRSCVINIAKTTPVDQAAQADLENLGKDAGGGSSSSSSDTTDDSGDGGGGGDGFDDFGGGGDFGEPTADDEGGGGGAAEDKPADNEEPAPKADQ
jgi:hypothetical protein